MIPLSQLHDTAFMDAHIQSVEELQEHFDDHLHFLKSSADAFDNGFDSEAKRLAVSIRVMVHDTKNSHSLLKQLTLDRPFYDTCMEINPAAVNPQNGLLGCRIGLPTRRFYYAPLDEAITEARMVEFGTWWNAEVIIDKNRNRFSRKDIVLAVVNKDGGAHVDPSLNAAYSDLSRKNSMGWLQLTNDQGAIPVEGPEKAAVRQIAHEILKTFISYYSKMPSHSGIGVAFRNIQLWESTPEEVAKHQAELEKRRLVQAEVEARTMRITQAQRLAFRERGVRKLGRNDTCTCGSGIKYKKCCGRP